jgi:hypothetical protein
MPTETPEYFTNMIRWGKDPLREIFHRIPKLVGKHWVGRAYLGEKTFTLVWVPFIILLWNILRRKTTITSKILLVVLLAITMVAPFSQIILLGGYNSPTHTFFAQGLLFATLWSLAIQYMPKIKPEWVMLGVFILYIHNGYRVTQTFHYDSIAETAEKNLIARIITRLDDMEINLEENRLLVVGKCSCSPLYPSNRWSFGNNNHYLEFGNLGFASASWRAAYALQVQGFTRTKLIYPSRQQIIKLTPIIDSMPIWPAKMSIKLVDCVVIIKLSNDYNLETDYPDWCLPNP